MAPGMATRRPSHPGPGGGMGAWMAGILISDRIPLIGHYLVVSKRRGRAFGCCVSLSFGPGPAARSRGFRVLRLYRSGVRARRLRRRAGPVGVFGCCVCRSADQSGCQRPAEWRPGGAPDWAATPSCGRPVNGGVTGRTRQPGICASSGSFSQTGFHSGRRQPRGSTRPRTSSENVRRTSSLSRCLRPSSR